MYFLIRVAYDGSKYYGFQRLKENNSVQKSIEDALTIINKKRVVVKGAGRTDRGVHALDQCVSFKLDVSINEEGLRKALNSLIGPYIYVKSVEIVDSNFHARFSVDKKMYLYKINLGEYNPLLSDYVYQCKYKLDIDKMKKVAKKYIGIHDFSNFVSGERESNECIIYDITFEKKGDILEIRFLGKSFYRYMVRNLVGMMIEVSRGKEDITKIETMLNAKKDLPSITAPACGLYLEKVFY